MSPPAPAPPGRARPKVMAQTEGLVSRLCFSEARICPRRVAGSGCTVTRHPQRPSVCAFVVCSLRGLSRKDPACAGRPCLQSPGAVCVCPARRAVSGAVLRVRALRSGDFSERGSGGGLLGFVGVSGATCFPVSSWLEADADSGLTVSRQQRPGVCAGHAQGPRRG